MVEFTSIDSITIDGVSAGNIVDVLDNHKPLRKEVLEAYRVFSATQTENAVKDKQLSLDALKETHDKVLAQFGIDLEAQRKQASDEFEKRINDLTTNHNEAVKVLNENNSFVGKALTNEKEALDAQVDILQAEVTRLEAIKSFDDSLIGIDAFMARIRPDFEWLVAEAQEDPQAGAILKMLLAKKGTKENPLALPVNLKSPNLIGALEYLASRGKLEPQRIVEITRPASREEAYDAD